MERLGENARRLLAAAGAPRADEVSAVAAVWRECVGEAIARASWPRRVSRDGTLHVATTSSTWAFELDRLAGEILARLGPVLGEATPSSLRFAPGPVPEPAADDPAEAPVTLEITDESRAGGEAIAAPLESAELRELVARAAAASLERSRSDRAFC